MKDIVQARLGPEERELLVHLGRTLGWTPSRIVRESLRLMAVSQPATGRSHIAGLGKFCSGKHDLGSNKKHLEGFGS